MTSLFLGREAIRIRRVDRREHLVGKLVGDAVDDHRAGVVVDTMQKLAILEAEARVIVDEARLHLELDDGHGLLDLDVHLELLRGQIGVAFQAERHARVVLIRLERERRERQDVDAVSVFQYGQVAVPRAVAHHVRDAPALPERGAHPHDVVVAPLNVEGVIVRQGVHDGIRMRTAVVNIADDVQVIDGQPLDEQAKLLDERAAAPRAYDRVDDGGVVGVFIRTVTRLGHKLLDDVGEIGRERFAHLRARVLARRMLAHRHEARQRGGIPCARVVDLGQDKLHLLARVVDERGERALLRRRERIAEHLVDFKTHVARPVAQDMRERLVLTVNVGCEELGALRKVQNRAQLMISADAFAAVGNDFARSSR